jgi:dTDP-glucose 4,6-dehydratase
MDHSKLSADLGWQPSVDLEEGLRRTVRWYIDNSDWLEAVMDESYRSYYDSQYSHR